MDLTPNWFWFWKVTADMGIDMGSGLLFVSV
jgi:hypothetical protein